MILFTDIIHTLPQVMIDGLTLGAVYAVIALGYTMVYGILELINFAHGEIFMTGAFIGTAVLLGLTSFEWISVIPAIISLIFVLLLTSILTGFIGMGIERVAYRPLRNAPKLIALITAIGISFLLQDIVRFITELYKGNYIVSTPSLFNNQIHLKVSSILSQFQNVSFKSSFLVVLIVAFIMMIGLDFLLTEQNGEWQCGPLPKIVKRLR